MSKTSSAAIAAATEPGYPANIDQSFDTTDVNGAAKYTGLSKSSLDKLRVFGGGPVFVKYSRKVAYRKRDLDDWMNSKRRISTSDAGEGARV